MKRILFILSFFVTLTLHATTYYVDPLTGSDAAAGTIAAPWQSLYHATQTATAFGDIIHLNAGAYTESHECPLAPGVSIEGAGKLTTTVTATNVTNFGVLLRLYSVAGTDGSQHITGISFQTVRTTSGTDMGIVVNGRSNVQVHDCHFEGFRWQAAAWNGRDENTGDPSSVGNPFVAPVGNEYATGNKFYNNTSNNCSSYRHDNHDGSLFGYFGTGHVAVGSQDGFEMYNNVMTQDNGISGYNGWLVKIGNGGFIKNCLFHNNTWTKNKFMGDYLGDFDFPFVFEMWNSTGNNKIYSNTIVGGGLDMAYSRKTTGTYSWEIYDNYFRLPELNNHRAVAIIFETGCDGALVENNRISKYFNGIIISVEYFSDNADHNNPYKDMIIRKNLFDSVGAADFSTGDESIQYNGNAGNAIFLGGIAALNTDSITRVLIDHNTFVGAPNHKPYSLLNFNNNDNHAVKHDWKLTNNIFKAADSYWLTTGNDVGTPITGLQMLNNTTFGNGSSNQYDFGSPNPLTPTISGTLTSDPLLTSSYTLGVGSGSRLSATDGTNRGHTGGADTIPPTVVSTNPVNGAVGVVASSTIVITFDGFMDAATLISANVYIGGKAATLSVGPDYVILIPTSDFANNTTYTVHVENVKDATGNTIAAPFTMSFTTQINPPNKIINTRRIRPA